MRETAPSLHWKQKSMNPSLAYTQEEYDQLKKQYEVTVNPIPEETVVTGTVVAIHHNDVIINTGDKADGTLSLSEFRDMPGLQAGDQVEVYIEKREDKHGQLVFSRKKAKLVKVWSKIQDSADNGTILEALVKRRTKGGLIADIDGVEVFLPGSQIDIKPIIDFDSFVDKVIRVVVIKINHQTDNVIISQKAVIERELESQKDGIINKLEKGQILEGIVKNITKFGVFIDLGGIDGLLHITDIAWERVPDPNDVFTIGDKVRVVVTGFDEERRRVSLGKKQLTPSPWDTLSLTEGEVITGKIVNITDYGAFLEYVPGVEGLIHMSSLSWSPYSKPIEEYFRIGDEVKAVVRKLDVVGKKMSLSVKHLTPDPWEKEGLEQKYAPGTKHQAKVKNIAHFGAIVELEEGIYGLLRISDLSWTKKINHPSDELSVGDSLELVVVEFDKENRKISLSRKHLEENPWEVYESDFQIGSIHKGTITKKTEKGTFVQLAHGLEGIIPSRYLTKEPTQEAAVNEPVNVEIIDFSKLNKRIILAQTDSSTSPASKQHSKKEQPSPRPSGSFTTAEKTTLGDIRELAMLKQQLGSKESTRKTTPGGKGE